MRHQYFMSRYDLASDAGLVSAIQASQWDQKGREWLQGLGETLAWFSSKDEAERGTVEVQKKLWDDNHVAAVGQGNISIQGAIADEEFRRRVAALSMEVLPESVGERIGFLTSHYESLVKLTKPFVRSIPHLKIFRVLAVMYPEAMTTVAKIDALTDLCKAMGGDSNLTSAGRHAWVRHRLDELLGAVVKEPAALAERMSIPWFLYEGLFAEAAANPSNTMFPELDEIVAVVKTKGHFERSLIEQLHFSLWAHPTRHFAILSGLSGSGKTLLARAYAEAISGERTGSQLLTLPVQPGWYDPGALLGYLNPLRGKSYVRTRFLQFLMEAAADPGRPYVVVLDEMNLSHPEQYMAPLLSAMETGDSIQLHTEEEILDMIPRAIRYPVNLAFIGTVNMDETTHGLSDKVLDRAFVHEFWDVDLDSYPGWGRRQLEPAHEDLTRRVLGELMMALSPVRLHFGWRVVDAVMEYLSRAAMDGSKAPFIETLDSVIYAKVLPKLRGDDTARFRDAIAKCIAVVKAAELKRSCMKLEELIQDLATTGSARFWR